MIIDSYLLPRSIHIGRRAEDVVDGCASLLGKPSQSPVTTSEVAGVQAHYSNALVSTKYVKLAKTVW